MKHIVFFIAYLYFLYADIKRKEIDIVALGVYAAVALFTIACGKMEISMNTFVDTIFSILFGLTIYILSYFSNEGIGIGDGMFFVINGLLLTLKENIVLFLSGLLVAFMVGIVIYVFKKKDKGETLFPFMPCCLPAIIGYILCIV